MAENITVKPSEGSKEAVAFKLLEKIMYCDPRQESHWSKDELLDTYVEALQATGGYRPQK